MAQNQLLLSRARSAVLARDFTLAARLYKQLLRDDRDNIELLNQLGDLYMKSGKDDQALSVFKRIAELNGDDSSPLITIGGIYRRLKDYENSIATLEQALVLDGTNSQISYNLGFTYKVMGDFSNAIGCFEDAIEMNPDDVLAYNHLGTIYAQRDEHEKAVQSYLRGLNIDANHPVLLLNIAKSYEALGEYDKACTSYSGALRSRPLWIEAIDGYARLLISTHRSRDAYDMVNRAVAVNPKDQNLKEALENVRHYISDDEPDVTEMPEEEEKIKIPSIFENLERVDDSEFDSKGLEIHMEDADAFSALEDEALEPTVEEINAGLSGPSDIKGETDRTFNFDSMGMDDLAGDGPLDDMFFAEHDNSEPVKTEEDVINFDDLITNNEAPVDTAEEPVLESNVFEDPFRDDEDFLNNANQLSESHEGGEAIPEMGDSAAEGEEAATEEEQTPEEQLADMTEELKLQVEKAQDTLEKAQEAAEKAWDAAQMAADSAQLTEALQQSILDASEDEAEIAEEENIEEPVESTTEDEIAEDEMSEDEVSSQDVLDAADQALLAAQSVNASPELSLFIKLRELIDFLPEGQKDKFMSSRARIKLDYVISKLAGEPGLFGKINSMIDAGEVEAREEFPVYDEAQDGLNPELLEKGLKVLKNLVALAPDESLKEALTKQIEIINL